MKTIRLSETQRACLAHRLEVGDAIADALSGVHDPGEVIDAAEILLVRMESGSVWATNDVERAVLEDAVTGSTYFAVSEGWGGLTGLALSNVERTVEATTRKVGEYLGCKLEPVTW